MSLSHRSDGLGHSRPKYATDFIIGFLARENRPMTTAAIRAALRQADISIKDTSLNWTLTNLNTRGQIRRLERGVYVINDPQLNLLRRARGLILAGSFREALEAYEEAISRFSPDPIAYNGRAETLRRVGRLDEALAAYEDLLTRFPEHFLSYNGYAETLRRMGRLEEALTVYERTLERFPNDVVALDARAELLREMGRTAATPPKSERLPPPPEDAIPAPARRAFQFVGGVDGPIELVPLSQPGEHLAAGPSRQEDYAELRVKAREVSTLGGNRLGRLHGPIDRFLSLSNHIEEVRAKLFWSRINTLRLVLLSHEQTMEPRNTEPDERRLEPTAASLLKDLVETINVFVLGDSSLMELDANRPGPQETEIAKEETRVIAPVINDLPNSPNVATQNASDILTEQVDSLEATDASLPGRQAAEFGRRSIQNFVGELLRRAYGPVHELSRRLGSETGMAWKALREGAYRAVGAGLITGAGTDFLGVTDFSGAIIRFVVGHAEALIVYLTKAFQNPALVEIINWIVRIGS
ncbi:MAG: hypothetical protein QOF41_2817 [Methylobacteriaceae bacterium]|nr:hypothetical protein [Methylobacteriaceae bacterium]